MDDKVLCKELNSLIQLDIDAVNAYSMAIRNVDLPLIADQLTQFRGDHERHVTDLSEIVRRHGGQPPKVTPDFKGFLISGFTAIRSATGTEGALHAMKSNEGLTTSTYQKAVAKGFPADVIGVVQRNFEDEQRHLRYIEQCLRDRPWESTGAHV
ncbi:MAG: DUF2383 domain-containing protein [Deltaproteobacteria bacterium]